MNEALKQYLPKDYKRRAYYTPFDVAIHNTANDLWVSFFGKVWDLTQLVQENISSKLCEPLIKAAGSDVSYWFDKSTGEPRKQVDINTGLVTYYCPQGRYLHIPAADPCGENELGTHSIPWWKNETQYCIGNLSHKTRKIKIINMLTDHEDIIEVFIIIILWFHLKKQSMKFLIDIRKQMHMQLLTHGKDSVNHQTWSQHQVQMESQMKLMNLSNQVCLKANGIYQLFICILMMIQQLLDQLLQFIMSKHNMKWRINSQKETTTQIPSQATTEVSPRIPIYLTRREKKVGNSQGKSPKQNYTKYVFHSNQISPTSSPNVSKIIKYEEQHLESQKLVPIERNQSTSSISTQNRSTNRRLSPKNINIKTDTIDTIPKQFTEQIATEPQPEIVKKLQIEVEGSDIVMKQKQAKYDRLFDQKKKIQILKSKLTSQFKDTRKSTTLVDQVVKLIRTIKQPSYRPETKQSRIWVENASFEPLVLKQKYIYSQSQFKIYFSQYFDKHLKLFSIIDKNKSLLELLGQYHDEIKQTKEFRQSRLIHAEIIKEVLFERYLSADQFRFQSEIKTYGMIDFLNENSQMSISEHSKSQGSAIQHEDNVESDVLESDFDEEFFKPQKQWHISGTNPLQIEKHQSTQNLSKILIPIVSELDTKTKNRLLSVDYTIIDLKIYNDNINSIVPTCEEYFQYKHIMSHYSKIYLKQYKSIFEGSFVNLNEIDDVEYQALILELKIIDDKNQENTQNNKQIKKKQMMYDLKERKNFWHSHKVEVSSPRSETGSHRATMPGITQKIQDQIQKNQVNSPEIIEHRLPPLDEEEKFQRKMHGSKRSYHGRQALTPQHSQISIKTLSQHSLAPHIEKEAFGTIKMTKSFQQIEKKQEPFSERIKFIRQENSFKNFNNIKLIDSIHSDQLQCDSLIDSLMLNQYVQQKSSASPQGIKLRNLMIFDQMIKKSRSKVKIAALLIEHGMVDELKELMEENRNFNLNSINEDGIPLISIAASSGYSDIVQFMLNFNLNINALDRDGNPPIHYAMTHNNYQIVDLLIQNGANPRIRRN